MAAPPKKRQKVKQLYDKTRGHCFTLYHCDGFDCDTFGSMTLPLDCPIKWPAKAVWGICQIEQCPETKRFHIQGAVWFKSQTYPNTLVEFWGDRNHYEKAKGSAQQNSDYCSKSASRVAGPWMIGTMPTQGKRTDWHDASDMLKSHSVSEVVLAFPHLAPCKKGLDVLAEALLPLVPIKRDMMVFYLWGPTGVGKSHRVHYAFPDAYVIKGKLFEGKSFDNYLAETCLFIDEWRSDEWPLTTMNAILDCWPFTLQCRYANKKARWTTVVIVSNQDPVRAYPMYSEEIRQTFVRRLNRVIEVRAIEDVVSFEK